MFQALKLLCKVLGQVFQALEHKFPQGGNNFHRRGNKNSW